MVKLLLICMFAFLEFSSESLLQTSLSAKQLASRFEDFKLKFNKKYHSTAEERKRFEIFRENLALIHAHNSGDSKYTLKVTQFADKRPFEFKSLHMANQAQLVGGGPIHQLVIPSRHSRGV